MTSIPSRDRGRTRRGPSNRLLADLTHYGIDRPNLRIDWSEACQEGHCTSYLDGNLEQLSGVVVLSGAGELLATGGLDFIHGGLENPLFVSWLFLASVDGSPYKADPGIPEHVWQTIPEASKKLSAADRLGQDQVDGTRVQEYSSSAW